MTKSSKFIGSYPKQSMCPRLNKPEYAFIGRSNVGKSSLINMLLERRQIAKVSSTPGKTQMINLFNIDDTWVVADLPGYGYARVSKGERRRWEKMINYYLKDREDLALVLVLIDQRLPPQENDLEFLIKLGQMALPFAIIFTKADKVKEAEGIKNKALFEEKILEYWESMPPSFVTSSKNGKGREEVLSYIADINEVWSKS